ncbi:hypothetical protein FRX31_005749 [Thalictrum thalictroides]|uniref:Uncharacterized protein n=1 Tax=Thalictrum thalictroides TaxID=46969 RepID=A0A7J6X707_THATH|nr:hypothetical protein FRX31_005749 [Thalictrum thalictroides]
MDFSNPCVSTKESGPFAWMSSCEGTSHFSTASLAHIAQGSVKDEKVVPSGLGRGIGVLFCKLRKL